MGTQQNVIRNIKGILCIARRMILRQIQRLEIVVVVFDLRSLRDGKSHSDEDIAQHRLRLRKRMTVPDRKFLSRNRYVKRFRCQPALELTLLFQLRFCGKRLFDSASHFICQLPDKGTLLGRNVSHSAQNGGQLSFFTEIFDPKLLDIVRGIDLTGCFFSDFFQQFLHSVLSFLYNRYEKSEKQKAPVHIKRDGSIFLPRYHPNFRI